MDGEGRENIEWIKNNSTETHLVEAREEMIRVNKDKDKSARHSALPRTSDILTELLYDTSLVIGTDQRINFTSLHLTGLDWASFTWEETPRHGEEQFMSLIRTCV